MKNIDFSLDNFKGIINQTKFVVENQKKKYSNLKHKLMIFWILKKKIIKYYLSTKKAKKNNNSNIINLSGEEIDKEIKKLKEKENLFLHKETIKLKNFIDYNNNIDNYNANLK